MIHSKIRCRFGGQQYDASNYPKVIKTIFFLIEKSLINSNLKSKMHIYFKNFFFSSGMI